MERESFENDAIAGLLNREYISIKVDREERPDVDAVYMSVCMAMNGQGGWPLTIIMTPGGAPFFAGTYLPPTARYGSMGLEELLTAAAAKWKENRGQLLESAEQLKAYLKEQERLTLSADPGMEAVHQAFRQFAGSFDKENGGFGSAPRFPTPHNLMFLMEYGIREKKPEAMDMVEKTLTQMYRGGIFDHIGGGFSRYSTDDRWLVPHFEKMLYDNALLVMAYSKAYALTGRSPYGYVAGKILDYVASQLTDIQGGFYCGQDADSDGVEGKYYVFTPQEVEKVLGKERGKAFCSSYGITARGNFEGKSIPNLLDNLAYEAVCEEQDGLHDPASGGVSWKEALKKLYEYRVERTKLHRDDKILVSWNGWMICACAAAGAVTGEKRYTEMAVRAELFIRKNLEKDGRLLVRYRDGDVTGEGKLEDYACFTLAQLMLYRLTFETEYLSRATSLAETMLQQFFDSERGGFYLYAKEGEQLIVRTKEAYDGALPSGNSVGARVLQLLAQITGEAKWQEALDRQLRYLSGAMEGYPSGHSYALITMMNVLYPSKELVCTLSSDYRGEERQKLFRRLGHLEETIPGLSIVVKTGENEQSLGRIAPYTLNYPTPEEGALFYLCSGGKCNPPSATLEKLLDNPETLKEGM